MVSPLARCSLCQASYSSGSVGLAFGLVVAAGACTCLGASLVFCSSLANHRLLSGALGVSAGVMTYVSFVEIFCVKAVGAFADAGFSDNEAWRYSTLCFFGGAAATWLLGRLVHALLHVAAAAADRRERRVQAARRQGPGDVEAGGARAAAAAAAAPEACPQAAAAATATAAPGPQPAPARGAEEDGASAASVVCEACGGGARCPEAPPMEIPKGESAEMRRVLEADHHTSLARTGLLSALAVGMHNVPEGLATFVAALASPSAGAAIAVAIALHNIPEGVVVAMPIYYATGSKWKGFFWSFVSGAAEPIGGLIGYALISAGGGVGNPLAFAVSFGFVAGVMVYIAVKELLPTALRYDPEDTFATSGFFGGAAVMAASLLLFKV
ncbi:Zinc transporter zupT [Monoraphidium neglectum]|uniref:Zinc transporter zupT n=1 Tax=Monoraphidium neglectum TaxID=145388 RepID=A0A0D2MRR4_9CHLO|nr:Zinc transporter zupT [Monoraphidium neglectum]KIY97245.1 Zinc transporter zupT [Monoraphidium neglectum]|eukprot:XP_013896265.1 Zinc transporter zupT [Monoraphidium neglectum]